MKQNKYGFLIALILSLSVLTGHAETVSEAKKAQITAKAQAGDPKAQITVGDWYYEGENGMKRDYMQAKAWYERAVAQNDPEAMHYLAYLYAQGGFGLEPDYAKAREYYLQAIEEGYEGAMKSMNNLGVLYRDGQGVAKDYDKAHDYFTQAAKKR